MIVPVGWCVGLMWSGGGVIIYILVQVASSSTISKEANARTQRLPIPRQCTEIIVSDHRWWLLTADHAITANGGGGRPHDAYIAVSFVLTIYCIYVGTKFFLLITIPRTTYFWAK
jgi:hypothetical protein